MEAYFVVEVYYKHGEHDIHEFATIPKLTEYLIDHILEHEKCGIKVPGFQEEGVIYSYTSIPSKEPKKDMGVRRSLLTYLKGLSLSDLVELAIRMGRDIIDKQDGWGIIKVVKGISL